MRVRRAGRFSGAALTLLTVLGGTLACGSVPGTDLDPGDGFPAGRQSRPAPASSAEIATASQAALAAYAGYLDASREASRVGDPFHPALPKYLADPLLTRVRLTIRTAKEHGAMRTGTLKSDPVVTSVDLDNVPATVEIQDCLDATGYRLVDVKTKKAVPGTSGRRYLATATATRFAGRWLISAGAAHEEQPC
ncbi:hypothetical protein [Micromonospora echinofusca]|uniref:Lipoprotein n=1 Tax=Micromonospora echinofusca TaxID=47858 RepID=A0ABS3W296_MICEH|nr:hypothetical protein [Micromonospora echinofusca]MBO4210905.1 hypothetical protein [Micromonospora echinofusca]